MFLQALPSGDGSVCLISADGSNNISIALVKSLVKSIFKKKEKKKALHKSCVCVCERESAVAKNIDFVSYPSLVLQSC